MLVLDNARLHHAAACTAHPEAWENQNPHLFYLSTYNSRFNKIETRWRKIKTARGSGQRHTPILRPFN